MNNKYKSAVSLKKNIQGKYGNRLINWSLPGSKAVFALALVFGLIMWIVDAMLDHFVFYKGYGSFIEVLITSLPPDEVYMRLVILICFVVFGGVISFHISKRKKIEEASKVTEEKYQQLFEQFPVSLWEEDFSELYDYLQQLKGKGVTDFRTFFDNNPNELILCSRKVNVLNVNQASLNLLQAESKEQLLGNLDKIFTKKSLNVFKEELIALDAGQLEFESEAEVKTLSGELRFIFLKLKIDVNQTDNVRALRAIMDITESKQVEKDLRRLASIVTDSNDAITLQDLDGNILAWNKGATKLYGYSEKEAKVMNIIELIPEDKREEGLAFITQIKEGELVESFETMRITKEGKRIELWLVVTKIEDNEGNVIGIVTTERDVTERKKAEKELAEYHERLEELIKERTEQLEESNKELKDFAYIVSHDLKAPLRAINQLSYWIKEDYSDVLDEDGKQQLSLLSNRVKRMDSLIEGILQYSKVGKEIDREDSISFDNLVKDVIASLEVPNHIKINIINKLPKIFGDKTRFIQVFQNLIGNSIKFMDKPNGQINIGCSDEGKYWKFSVEDNGAGIEKKYFDKVFQIFQSLEVSKEEQSTGIGLSIVKKIITICKGNIWLKSIAGKGLTVFFTIPKKI